MEYYWELTTRDGVSVMIAPDAVAKVNKHLAERTPILTKSGTILPHEVASFRVTSKSASGVPLLDAASQAFNEPQFTEHGSIVARWVKKSVTNRDWTGHYGKIPSYRKLADDGAHVWIAFRVPVHEIDLQKVDYCSNEEIARLERD